LNFRRVELELNRRFHYSKQQMVFKFIKESNVFSFKRGGQPRRLYVTLDLPSFGSCSPMPSACRVQYSGTVAPLSGLDHRRSATRPSTLYPLTHDQITRLSPDERLALIAQLWVRFLSKAKPRTPAEGVFELADQRWIKGFKGSKTNVQPRTVTNKKVVLVNSFFSHCFDQF
jgi:hypothetical protein